MPAALNATWAKVRSLVAGFSLAQRTLVVIGVAVLAMGAFGLSAWMSKPTMTPLFTGLSAADASAITDQLNSAGTKYQLTDGGGTIMVPQSQVYTLRLAAAAKGLPTPSTDGYSLLDKVGMTSSEFQQKVTYQRAVEGELAKTIKALHGVQAATVHLAIPAQTVFDSTKQDPTASVFVEVGAGATLSGSQVQAVVNLVSSAVAGMQAKDVSVVDATGKVLSSAGTGTLSGVTDEATSTYEQRVQAAVQTMLDRIVGPGHSVVTVAAELNYDAHEQTSETYTAPTKAPALSQSTTVEQYNGGSTASVGGVLGPDNIAVPTPTSTGAAGGYTKSSSTSDNGIDKTTDHTVSAPGTVRRQSISVALDKSTAAGLDLTQITSMVSAAAGANTARGDQVSVAAVGFDTSAATAAAQAIADAKAADKAAATRALIKDAVGGGLGLLVVVGLVIAFVRRSGGGNAKRRALDLAELQTAPEPAAEPEPLLVPTPVDPGEARRNGLRALVENDPDVLAEALRSWIEPTEGRS